MLINRTILVFILVAILSPAASRLEAQQLAWPGGTQISAGSGPAYGPRVVFDDEGFAHAVYYGGATQDAWAIYYTNNRTGAWAQPRLLSAPTGDQRLGDIAIGPDGHVHVVYERSVDHEIYHVESPDLGERWGSPLNISRSGGRAYEPTLAVDANNTLHVAWVDTRWSGVVQLTYAARPVGANFSPPARIGTADLFERGPSIATTGSGASVQVHIVFEARDRRFNDNGSFDVYYVGSAGGRFQPPRNISDDRNVWSLAPQIIAGDDRELFLVWDKRVNAQHDIVLARSLDAGATWSEPANISQTPIPSLTPRLALGRDQGSPQLHIVWSEDTAVGRNVFYVRFDPDSNSFGGAIERANDQPNTDAPDVGAALSVTQVAIVYQARPASALHSYVTSRGRGAVVTAELALNGGAASSTRRELDVTLAEVQGDPQQMRYALGRAPGDADPWLPFQPSFSLTVPRDGACNYTLFVQLRAADDRRSKLLQASILIDSEVQADVDLHNPYYDGVNSHPAYTNRPSFVVSVADSGECGALTRLLVSGSQQEFRIEGGRFANSFVLPGALTDGARPISARVEDSAGNRLNVTRIMTLDTVAPELLSGTLQAATPPAGLVTPLTRLQVEGLEARDRLYPGAAWGALVANVANPALSDSDPALVWRSVQIVRSGTTLTVERWNVLSGLVRGPADRTFAGQEFQVRLKILDGAGNPSSQTLIATARLAADYRPIEAFLPLTAR